MNCETLQEILDAYVDGELDPARRLAAEGHIDACAACRSRVANRRALRAAVANRTLRFTAPDTLARAVRKQTRARPWALTSLAATVAAFGIGSALTAALTMFAWSGSGPRPRSDALTDEIVSAHVRSLMTAQRLFDVASSDSHQIKPWFTGKLDFAPRVVDLSQHGFPLVGARLEYLGGRPVAALVYRHRQHTLNLFVWPADASARAADASDNRKGYQLTRWSRHGLEYWVISDLNSDDLNTFARLLHER